MPLILSLLFNASAWAIVGGEPVSWPELEAKQVVQVLANGGPCTGVVLGPRWILTAAHCLEKGPHFAPPGEVRVLAKRGKLVRSMGVREFHVHLGYALRFQSEAGESDLALIRLWRKLPYGFSPVTLAQADHALEAWEELRFVGYGVDSAGPAAKSGNLRSVGLLVLPKPGSSIEFMVAGREDVNFCSGDSGAPAFRVDEDGNRRLVGLVSRSETGCSGLGVATFVPAFADWIRDTAK